MIVADKIVVLRDGEIQQEGPPLHVYNEPKSIFVANFVGGANFFEGFVAESDEYGSWIQLRNGAILRVKKREKGMRKKA
jgi:putative spermidine/putrescine transport system ATP-binding protein